MFVTSKKMTAAVLAITLAMSLSACSNWSKRDRNTAIFGLYLLCYFLREFTEAHLMGKKMGLSPLETLAAIYVGLQLFGLFGFLLGPIGLLIIKDFVEEYGEADEGADAH